MDEFNFLKQPAGKSMNNSPNVSNRYMVTSSFINFDLDSTKKISDIEFKEVPAPVNYSTSVATQEDTKRKHDSTVAKELASQNLFNHSTSLYSNEHTVRDNNQTHLNSEVHPIQIHNQRDNAIFPTFNCSQASPLASGRKDLGLTSGSTDGNVYIFKSSDGNGTLKDRVNTIDHSLMGSMIKENSPEPSKSINRSKYNFANNYDGIRIVQKRERGSLASGIAGVTLAPKLEKRSRQHGEELYGNNNTTYKVGGSLIVGKLERKGSSNWEGGFQSDHDQFDNKRKASAFLTNDEMIAN